jgi:hypothetical protein
MTPSSSEPRDDVTISLHKQHLRNAHAILRGRIGRPTPADNAYNIYATLLFALIVIFPIARAIMVGLAVPEVAVVIAERLTPTLLTPVLLALTIGLILLGRIRGPVVPSAAHIDLIADSPLSRSVTLRRPYAFGRLSLIALALGGAVLLVGGAFFAGPIDLLGAGLFLVATILSAWQLALFWLIGQLSLPVRRTSIVLLCVALGVVLLLSAIAAVAAIPAWGVVSDWLGPWGWLSIIWQSIRAGVEVPTWIALGALILGLFVTRWTAILLKCLSHDDLAVQARRWGTVVTLVTSGDVKSAVNKLKAFPRIGRHWPVTFSHHPVLAIIRRDLRGLARFPLRTAFWAVLTVISGALLSFAFLPGSGMSLIAVATTTLLYFAVGSWAEGLRFHSYTIGASSPFGLSPGRLALLHLVVPTIVAAVLALIGVLIPIVLEPSLNAGVIVPWSLTLVVFMVVMQVFSAFKGMFPLELLTPVPTPLGDLSFLSVAFWLGDAVTIVLIVAGGLTLLIIGGTYPTTIPIVLAVATVLMVAWALARFRTLTRP